MITLNSSEMNEWCEVKWNEYMHAIWKMLSSLYLMHVCIDWELMLRILKNFMLYSFINEFKPLTRWTKCYTWEPYNCTDSHHLI